MSSNLPTFDELLAAARHAQRHAYAPYSKFPVGAALWCEGGDIVSGCNVENASYGLTNCAERVAIGRAVVQGAGKPLACLVVGPTEEPLTPCGACRQVLVEFNPEMHIVCVGSTGRVLELVAGDLLPRRFGADALDAAAKER